jgi:hypothetical protein
VHVSYVLETNVHTQRFLALDGDLVDPEPAPLAYWYASECAKLTHTHMWHYDTEPYLRYCVWDFVDDWLTSELTLGAPYLSDHCQTPCTGARFTIRWTVNRAFIVDPLQMHGGEPLQTQVPFHLMENQLFYLQAWYAGVLCGLACQQMQAEDNESDNDNI